MYLQFSRKNDNLLIEVLRKRDEIVNLELIEMQNIAEDSKKKMEILARKFEEEKQRGKTWFGNVA